MNIKKLSLKKKLILSASFPFLAYLFIASLQLRDSYESFKKANASVNNIHLFSISSALVHEVQKERAKTVGHLSGSVNSSELSSQWENTDKKISEWKVQAATFSKEFEDVMPSIERLTDLRNRVRTNQIEKSEAVLSLSKMIALIQNGLNLLALKSSVVGIPLTMKSANILETAKENAGRLRAAVIELINVNKPLSESQYQMVNKLRFGVEMSLDSQGLNLSSENKSKSQAFLSSESWKKTMDMINHILKNKDHGQFGLDSKEFYSQATLCVDSLAELINSELERMNVIVLNAKSESIFSLLVVLTISLISTISITALLMYLIKDITQTITSTSSDLTTSSNSVTNTSHRLSEISQELSAASTQAGASLQKTASAMDEISTMSQRNTDSTKKSQILSDQSSSAVKKGKQIVDQMITAIGDISDSSNGIAEAVSKSNQEISDIVKVIGNISEKTKVINEIVFQTKLLSFNASVEAARAGEHGKGFAVVAEEVGNLAQMSGNAAKEITEMLGASIDQVQKIVHQTKARVEGLVLESQSKVETGKQTAQLCGRSLDQILASVEELDGLIKEISHASADQSAGISEIGTSMNQMDQASQQNTDVAHQCANSATELNSQSEHLGSIVSELHHMLYGNSLSENQITPHFKKPRFLKAISNTSIQETAA